MPDPATPGPVFAAGPVATGAIRRVLQRPGRPAIAYHAITAHGKGATYPGVLFCGGFMSDMTGTKAMFLEHYCRERGQAFVRFDYSGHGGSEGSFREGTIGGWAEDATALLDHATEGPQIVIGSSMGGWIMSLLARSRPDRVAALIGIAAAPDFTEELMWPGFTPAQRHALETQGVLEQPSAYSAEPYVITRALIEDGRRQRVLPDGIDGQFPVRLLHGMRDPDVPWDLSIRLAAAIRSEDCRVILVKDGDHRLSRDQDLALLGETLAELSGRLAAS